MGPKTILVVEDDPLIAEVLQAVLDAQGYRTLSASDGTAALRALARTSPDLVVLDVLLPRIDGREVLRIMRGGAHRMVPVLLVSAATTMRPAEEDPNLRFLAKPFDLQTFVDEIAVLLRKSATGRRTAISLPA
jgi:DNA-binding response OmpR family regulator